MKAIRKPRAGAVRAAAGAIALGSLLAGAAAGAQETAGAAPPPLALAAPPTHADKAREAGRWDLPRLFYEPRQRRSLDAQDRALHLGLNAGGSAATGPRFDGWVAGPNGTHAWVSGAPYLADRSGRLHPAPERTIDAGADEMENAQAQFDKARGVLIVHRETEGSVHLRVGEADSPVDAAAPAGGASTPTAAPEPH
jgi:hypothetical protein